MTLYTRANGDPKDAPEVPGGAAALMDPVDFYRLPRTAQERFVGSVNGSGLPAPILRAPARPMEPVAWLAGSVVALVVLVALLAAGYGDLASGLAREGAGFCLAEVVLAGVVVLGVLRALAVRHEHATSPWKRGLYVFPVGLIDARTTTLRVYAIEGLRNVAGPDARGLTLDFAGKSFSFPVADAAAAETARSELTGSRGAVGEAGAARDSVRPKALAALDPLQGYANPLTSSSAIVRVTPPWATFAWAIAAVAGLVFGASLWMVRNARSDDALFAQVVATNGSDAYRAYLERGTRHADEVRAVRLPRALLAEVVKVGTVDGIQRFIDAHPEPAVAKDAAAALRRALLAELEEARKAGTLAALDEFVGHRPAAHLDAELAVARHAVYQAALERYTRDAAARSAPVPFVERLLAWSEAKGPRVEIRFHRLLSKTLEKADAAVGKSAQFRGVVSLPSRYFDDAAVKDEVKALTDAVAKRFAEAFPAEILGVLPGETITDPEAPLPATIAVPTLFVEYGAEWSGSIQASQSPRGVFVGLELSLDGIFRLPDATKPVKVKTSGWRLPDIASAKEADRPEDVVYAGMREKAFEPFRKKLLGAFFRDPI